MRKEKEFPNGFDCWHETHYEVVSVIEHCLNSTDYDSDVISKRYDEEGNGGMYLLALELTDEFEEKYKGVLWGEELDYNDTLEEFLNERLYA